MINNQPSVIINQYKLYDNDYYLRQQKSTHSEEHVIIKLLTSMLLI